MTWTVLGSFAPTLNPRGPFDETGSYRRGDAVFTGGRSWVCTADVAAQTLSDTFARPDVAGGWGTAPGAHPWVIIENGGATVALSAGAGGGTISADSPATALLQLASVGAHDADLSALWTMTRTTGTNIGGGPMFVLAGNSGFGWPARIKARRYISGLWYIEESSGGTGVAPFLSGVAYRTRLQLRGRTLRCRLWADGSDEPSDWEQTVTMDEAAIGAGYVGLGVFLDSGDSIVFSGMSATGLLDAPAADPDHWAALAPSPAQSGTPVLYGPYVVDYTDIPHDGDVKALWTPQVGDVLLRLFVDWKTVVQWNHGTISLGPNVDGAGNVNIIAGAIAGQIASSIRTYGVLDSVLDAGFEQNNDDAGNPFYSSAWVFHTTDPVQIQLTGTGGSDPTAGHVELYALVARAAAP